jgi:hypothetical protein
MGYKSKFVTCAYSEEDMHISGAIDEFWFWVCSIPVLQEKKEERRERFTDGVRKEEE